MLPDTAAAAAHAATGTLLVVTGAGQVVAVYALPADAAATVQLATGTFVVCTAAGHVTVV